MRRMLGMLFVAPVLVGWLSGSAAAVPLPPPPTAPVLELTPPPPVRPVLPFDPATLPVQRHPDGRPIVVGYGLQLR